MSAHPGASKYSARVDRSEANTSHALVLDLVGDDKRVLDVGCASGYLAEALTAQGNKVSGVEVDPDAAEKARPFLDRLVVGNVEELDLVGEFGAGQFDVLVFADVLEHVKDPVEVLRRARPLIADGGFAVLSIPNVAHASVRLSLLQGRFDYRPLGLLDDTHLRFFTRKSLEEMVAAAGYVSVDTRQTTAGPFDTEIPVDGGDYPEAVLATVDADPDSRTYQFVARVEPVDGGGSGLGGVLAERNRELHALRRTLAGIAALAGDGPTRPVVGVLDAGGGGPAALRALRHDVTRLELRRRLAGFEIRAYTLDAGDRPAATGADAVASLAPWGAGSAAALRRQVDAMVVLPGAPAGAAAVLAELVDAGVAVHRMDSDPEVLALAGRLVGAGVPAQRGEYLRVSGLIPGSRPFVLRVPGPGLPDPGPGRELTVEPPDGVSGLDLLGLVAAAERIVTADPAVASLAAGLGRPSGGPAGTTLVGLGGGDAGVVASRLAGSVDRYFDELHQDLMLEAGGRLAATVSERLAELRSRVHTLEAANAGLVALLGRERSAMAAEVARLRGSGSGPAAEVAAPLAVDVLRRDLDRSSADRTFLQDEIGRIYATKTMRVAAPLRRIYGRLRSPRP